MRKPIFVLLLNMLLFCVSASAQETQKSEFQQRAEAASQSGGSIGAARYQYIRAFEDYAAKGQMKEGVECAVKAAAMYHKENYYKEAFDLLRRVDQAINAAKQSPSAAAAQHYEVTKVRMDMYMKMRKGSNVKDQLDIMEGHANAAGNEDLKNDLLYNKAIYYYSFGLNAQGNAVFKEMVGKLTGKKEYDKVDGVYQTLIGNARKSGNANMVAQSYSNYIVWKDSVNALKVADKVNALKQQIAENEAVISEKDSKLTSRQAVIITLSIVAIILAAALILGGFALMYYIVLNRKQKKTIQMVNDNNALKAKFIGNISAQLEPSLRKLDTRTPEVKALLDFSQHVQTLAELENTLVTKVETEETSVQSFCEGLMNEIRGNVPGNVTLTVNAPKVSAKINKEYVSHILLHLLQNASCFASEGGTIVLEFKKRNVHTCQFLVSNTGQVIPEEKRDGLFKPFAEIRDLTTGDGLGLPICRLMAQKMDGDLTIDPTFTRGTRFVLQLQI